MSPSSQKDPLASGKPQEGFKLLNDPQERAGLAGLPGCEILASEVPGLQVRECSPAA